MGTSLGALAMLHAYCGYPDSLDALFLQSGSFFVPKLDSQERRFPYFRRITDFTAAVAAGGLPADPVPVVMTCGAIEENLGNNRLMLAAFRSRGYPADAARGAGPAQLHGLAGCVRPVPDRAAQAGCRVNRDVAELWSDASAPPAPSSATGTGAGAVLVFPTEQGKARDFEDNGMVAAVAGLLEAGRVKLYCVDSYDAASWSNQTIPLEERARRHGRLRVVDPRPGAAVDLRRLRRRARGGDSRLQPRRLPRG